MKSKKQKSFGGLEIPEVFKKTKGFKKVIKISIVIIIFLTGFWYWGSDSLNFHPRSMLQNDPVMIRAFAPSNVQKGELFEFTVECWDYCERLSVGYSGTVEFDSYREHPSLNGELIQGSAIFVEPKYVFIPSGLCQGFIEAYRIPWGDGGYKTFEASFTEPGIHYIVIRDDNLGIEAYSNPIMVCEEKPELYLYWGDIHGHTSKCDGSGDLDQVLFYAKNIACLDFASVTTHDQFINALISPIGWPLDWEHTKWVIEQWNNKNGFVTIQAHEWRGNFLKSAEPTGDRVLYSRTEELPFFPGADTRYANELLLNQAIKEWMAEQEGRKIMTIAHHPPHSMMGMRTDWSTFDPELTRMVEIYSVHGSSEMNRNQGNTDPLIGGVGGPNIMEMDDSGYHIRDALSMGYHIGFMASGDSHDGHIGHSISHTEARSLWQPPLSWSAYSNHMFRCHHWQQVGLIGVYAPDLSRTSIFDGIWNRSCYGVKGTSRPIVSLSINDVKVGDSDSMVTLAHANSPRVIKIDVAAGGGDQNILKKIEIIRNNQVWRTINFSDQPKRIYHGTLVDTDSIDGINYWGYANIDLETFPYKNEGKYYINENAIVGVDDINDYSTNGEMFYYLKVYTEGSAYYENMYNYYSFSGQHLIPQGDDIAWMGPIWVKSP